MSVLSKPASMLNDLIDWWADGLAAISRSRANRSVPWRTMLLRRGNIIEVHARRGKGTHLLGFLDPAATDEENRRVAVMVTRDRQSTDSLVLRLAPEEVVRTRLTLPAGVRDVLEKVLQNQIERIAPWPADQAFFAFAEAGVRAEGALAVDLWVVSKARVEELTTMLAGLGLKPGVIDVGSDAKAAPVINLRASESVGPAHSAKIRSAIIATATMALVLSAAGLAYGFHLDSRNQAMEADLQSAVRTAVAASKTRSPDLQRRQAVAFELRRVQPPISILIESLSRALPDEASLERIELRDGVVTISGKAQNAPALIGQLESSSHFADVKFTAPTTRQEGERSALFTISAKFVPQVALAPKSGR